MAEKVLAGKVTHYFNKIGVAVVELEGKLKVGDRISIEGENTNFEQEVSSMQIEKKEIKLAKEGQRIGLKVNDVVRTNDKVFKITK